MPNGLAVEARFVVVSFLKTWVDSGQLTYKFSVHENALQPDRVRATFSKPTQEAPAAAAVAYFTFHLDERLRDVLGFTVESETHFHSVTDLRFNEAIIDQVIRRKLLLKQQQLIRLSDEFSSTRVPALMKERGDEKRDHDRETLDEYLLERLQRKDPYNDGRISFQEFRDVLYALEFPTISRRDREILFAFVELDRDELVDYGALISIGAEVFDTLLHVHLSSQSRAACDSKDAAGKTDDHEALEDFQAVMKHQQFFTMDRLDRILDAHRPLALDQSATSENRDEAKSTSAQETIPSASDEASEAKSDEAVDLSRRPLTLPPLTELYVTRRELRTSLESPQLLLSRAEINLIVSLATTTPTGQIPCSQLGELLQHVQTMVFRFQSRCFSDRLAHYLQQQFANFESSNLQGTAEYLKKRLRQKEIKAVVKDMKKLMLTSWQVSRVASLCEHKPGDVAHVVSYMECVPKIAAFLTKQVDPLELQEQATAVHALLHDTEVSSTAPFPVEEVVLQAAAESFEAADATNSGVLSIAAFHSGLMQLLRSLGISLDDTTALAAITALADPMGHGRVHCNYFQQLVYPVLCHFYQEQRIRQSIDHSRHTHSLAAERADTKQLDADNDSEAKSPSRSAYSK